MDQYISEADLAGALTGSQGFTSNQNSPSDKLRVSLALMDFAPGCFIKGSPDTRVVGDSREPESMKFILTLADGGVRTFPLFEVPVLLWRDEFMKIASINRAHPHIRRLWREEFGVELREI